MRYFAYGSNMLSRRLCERVPSARAIGPATVGGYEMRFHKRGKDGSGKCTLVDSPRELARVHGVVFDIDPAEKDRLDEAESSGLGYEEVSVRVDLAEDSDRAFTYVARPDWVHEGLLPFEWYLDLVVAGGREHGLPDLQMERLAASPSIPDPDPERRAAMRALLNGDGA